MLISTNAICVVILAICVQSQAAAVQPDRESIDANQIVVKGVFFVPKDGPEPTAEDIKNLNKHIQWSRSQYLAMLNGRDTFEISRTETCHSSHTLDYYRKKPEDGAPWLLDELFEHFSYDRNTCPYIYVIIVANQKDDFPTGGGRNFNGGLNLGGGMVIMSLYALRNSPNFQSTLRHELGHSFGLVHVEAYGYDMNSNDSIMSYNEKHHTNFFKDSNNPGILIPEDLCALAGNKRVFRKLKFYISKDVPEGYEIKMKIITLNAIKLPEERN
jgi:hypothetical protein